MTPAQKAAALAAYRDRKAPAGIYAIRNIATGQAWVGSSGDLEKIANRHWFTLAQGTHPNKTLQADFTKVGQAGFRFDVLETLPEDTPAHTRTRLLTDMRDAHCEALSAERL